MLERLKEIFRDILGVEINDNSTPDNTDNWDSLHHLSLIVAIEEEFNVEFTMNEISKIKSVEQIMNILGGKLNDTLR